jgi:magnesium chelatase family protein
LDKKSRALLESAAKRWSLSARSLDRILKVARTIADLEGVQSLASAHVAEALALSGRYVEG